MGKDVPLLFPSLLYIDGLVQERRNSIANERELRLFALTHRYVPR